MYPANATQAHAFIQQHAHRLFLQLRFQLRLELALADELRFNPVPSRAFKNHCAGHVAQHDRHLPRNPAAGTRLQDRFAIGSASRTEHPDSKISGIHHGGCKRTLKKTQALRSGGE